MGLVTPVSPANVLGDSPFDLELTLKSQTDTLDWRKTGRPKLRARPFLRTRSAMLELLDQPRRRVFRPAHFDVFRRMFKPGKQIDDQEDRLAPAGMIL